MVRGKTLCLCLALDPKQFIDTKYKIKDLSIRSPKTKTPTMYRISNDRRLKYAKELIDVLFADSFQLKLNEIEAIDYTVAYASTEELIERKLIRVVANDNFEKPIKTEIAPVDTEVVESEVVLEPTIEATPIEEVKQELETVVVETPVEEEPKVEPTTESPNEDKIGRKKLADLLTDEVSANIEEFEINGQIVRYNRSFLAAISQASNEVKERYNILKNYLLSYKNIKSRTNWKMESFTLGNVLMACFVIRNQKLYLCLAGDPKQYNDSKFNLIDLTLYNSNSKLPCMYSISDNEKVPFAKELIDRILKGQNTQFIKTDFIDFSIAYETTEELIKRGLIRVSAGEKEK